MIRRITWPAALMLVAGASGTVMAQRPPRLCLTGAEAEALTLAVAPDLLRGAGLACADALPANSFLRQPPARVMTRFQAEADTAWPRARTALAKLAGPEAQGLLESMFARTLLTSLVTPLILGGVKPRDCPVINRMATLLEPLPARNIAGLVVSGLQLAQSDPKARQAVSGLPLCPVELKP